MGPPIATGMIQLKSSFAFVHASSRVSLTTEYPPRPTSPPSLVYTTISTMKLLTSSSVLVISALALASLAPQPTMAADSCGSGACLTNYDPVCGSDGKTYSNACELSRAKCTNTSLTQKSTGECSSTGSSSTGGTAVCAQEFACTSKYDPVCGSDGKTYANACELKRATCANPAVVLKSTGECFSSSSDSSASGSADGNGATVCKIKGCTKEYKPVCGSDNKTYANKCTFANAQCETPALTLRTEDACEGDSDSDSVAGDADAPSLSGSGDDASGCVTMCTKESEPVCGSNGLTYENACLLKNAQCSNATLSKASDSACPTVAPATGSAATATTAVGIQVAALAVLSAVLSLML